MTASGANLNLSAKTDARGTFRFSAIPIGTYTVTATAPKGTTSLRVDVPGAGAAVTLSLGGLRQIGRTSVTARPPVRGSGTDLSLNAEALTRSPAGGSLPNLLVQLPGAARGANGVVHINGDHGDINYIVDGVQIRRRSTAPSGPSWTRTTSRSSKRSRARTRPSTASASPR